MQTQIKKLLGKQYINIKYRLEPLKNSKIGYVRKYNQYIAQRKINEHMVLFQAYQATRMSCNPMAIFLEMRNDPYFKGFTYVWALDEQDNYYANQYKNDKSVIFCKVESEEYVRYLSTAKYLVNNKTFPYYFRKREGQVHLSTWHGIPLKTLGKKQYGSMGQYSNVSRNYIHTDYLVMPDRFTANVLLECCDLTTAFNGYVVDAGYPRTDFTVNTDYNEMREFLKEQLDIDITKKIVLYAPTWRGEVGSSQDTTSIILKNLTDLSDGLPEGYILLLKIHDRTYTYVKNNKKLKKMKNVPDWMETNQLLAAVDILITDYSSLYFDFLCLRRPTLFFVYDREEYESTRGLYFDMETEVPGPLCYTADQVNVAIRNIDEVYAKYEPVTERLIREYCYNDDGSCTKRVLNIVFKGKDREYIYKVNTKDTKRIAVYAGTLSTNPYAMSIISQLNHIKSENIELYLVYNRSPIAEDEYYLKKLNPNIKVFYRVPVPDSKYTSYFQRQPYMEKGLAKKFVSYEAAKRYKDHYFGDIKFDLVIDFWGEPSFWQLVFAKNDFGKKITALPKVPTNEIMKYMKQHFDQLLCFDVENYKKYKKMLDKIEGKAELIPMPIPIDMSDFSKNLQEDLTYVMSYVKTAAVSMEQGKEEFYYNEHINSYEEEMRIQAGKAGEVISESMEKVMTLNRNEYEKCKQQFETLFL